MEMSDKIADNPSFKRVENDLKNIGCASRLMPWMLTKEQRLELKRIKNDLDMMKNLPDRFNSLYLERGWVCFGGMNYELVRRCINLGENNNLEKGEQELIDYFKGEIQYLIYPLKNISGFKERYELLQKAIDDYNNNRYYACVPVFLMIIDGAVNQVLKRNQGLFAQDVDLTLYDSVIGHKNGLLSLIQLMSKSRKKTTTTPIDIPYRNGILHGMDVCYDNELVATKALVTIFAVAEWIKHFCDGKHKESTREKPETAKGIEGFNKLVEKAKRLDCEKKSLKEWKPRDFKDIDFSIYTPVIGTPEYKIKSFMELYKKGNYGKMAESLIDYSGKSVGEMAGKIRSLLVDIKCIDYKIVNIVDNAPAISEILLSIAILLNNEIKTVDVKSRLIYQTDRISCSPLVRGNEGGDWFLLESVLYDISNKVYI